MITYVDGPDDLVGDRRAVAMHDPAAGCVVITAPVGIATGTRLAGDTLLALGKDPSCGPVGASEADLLDLASIWLQALDIRHLVVVQAQTLAARPMSGLLKLAASSGVDLWLLGHPGLALATEVTLQGAGATVSDWPAFFDIAGAFRRPTPLPSDRAEVGGDRVVDLLGAPTPVVGADYAAAEAWARGASLGDRSVVVRFLRIALDHCDGRHQAIATVHGLAAGLATRGLHLEPLATARDGTPVGLRAIPWSSLHRFWDSAIVAAAALARLGLGTDDMLRLRIGDMADESVIHLDDEVIEVPRAARPLLRAQRLAHDDGRPGARFLTERGSRPSAVRLHSAVASIFQAIDPRLRRDDVPKQGRPAMRWLDGQGAQLRRGPARVLPPAHDSDIDLFANLLEVALGGSAAQDGPIDLAIPAPRRRVPNPSDHPWKRSYDRPAVVSA